jgi:hypothetical protein
MRSVRWGLSLNPKPAIAKAGHRAAPPRAALINTGMLVDMSGTVLGKI